MTIKLDNMKSAILRILLACTLIVSNSTCKKENSNNPDNTKMTYNKGEGNIGKAGGSVVIKDPASPINGAIIDIPQDALTGIKDIKITVNNSKRPTGDSTSTIIELLPNGLTFSKPITVTIPIKGISKPKLFYYLPDSDNIEQVYITETNLQNGYIKAEINHFSRYFVTDEDNATFVADLFNTSTGIKANVKFGALHSGNITLSWIPIGLFFAVPSDCYNALDMINKGAPDWGTQPNAVHAHLIVKLLEGNNTLKTIEYEVRRIGSSTSNLSVRIKQLSPSYKLVYESKPQESDTREAFFNGKALIFDFGIKPENGKNYYLALTWYLAQDPTIEVKMTTKYTVNSYNYPDVWTSINMKTSDPDIDKNLINDEFDVKETINLPTVTTTAASSITQTTATSGGNITSDGGAAVTARGVCWATVQNPTTINSKSTDGTGTGSFSSNITGLTANTTYYVRSYATNSQGTSYGTQITFTTGQSLTLPIITTNLASSITQTTATSGGNITSDGGAAVIARGVCWATVQNPTTINSKTTDGNGTSSFTSNITGLTANSTYYIRAYATNSVGTAYGNQQSFKTLDNVVNQAPAIPSAPSPSNGATDIANTMTISWTCTDPESDPLTYDFYFGTTATLNTITETALTSPGLQRNNLSDNTTYYWKVVAKDNKGNSTTSPVWSFTTKKSTQTGKPDLVIDSYTYSPQNPTLADEITFTAVVKNAGTVASSILTGITIKIGDEANPPSYEVPVLTPNQTSTFTRKITLAAGTYQSDLLVDFNNLIDESDETNNSYQISLVVASVNPQTGTVTDIEGNTYKTIIIGTQEWMAENLKTTKYNDGTAIPNVTDATAWADLSTPAYCWYNNDAATNKATYGALYNWYVINTGKLCSTGWHVPTDAEWSTLTTFLGGESVSGGKLKEIGKSHWNSPNTGADNSSGFSALPGGSCFDNGYFYYNGHNGYWWSSNESDTFNSWFRSMGSDISYVYRTDLEKKYGFSVRCVKD
jgi:uncharacterized protein (TIGR02145 family)